MRTTMMIFMDKCDHVADPHRPIFIQAVMYKRQKIKKFHIFRTVLFVYFPLLLMSIPPVFYSPRSPSVHPPSVDREKHVAACVLLWFVKG